jgi:hypothetical protein
MQPSTGITSLDEVLCGLRPGDNVVWQVHSIDDYLAVVEPFAASARTRGDKLVYFRFARHEELVGEDTGTRICRVCPEEGFEKFITEIHEVIRQTGSGGRFVFDSLSELVLDCYSERMLGNFFMLTCPFLRQLDTIAYFAVLKNYHSYYAALPISKTTQLFLDVYRREGRIYIHPLKVDQRHSPTMYTLHAWEKDELVPITDSATISDVVTSTPWPGLQSASYRMVGKWDRRFMQGEDILDSYEQGECTKETVDKAFHRLLPQLISRDAQVLSLAEKYLTLPDLIHTWKRIIGSGLVGGKATGMLVARAILTKADPRWGRLLEAHDSFFIGSDIFYSFLVENGCWEIRERQKNPDTFLDGADEARRRILSGRFPDYIVRRFSDMLDYFGQSPIIVRSSSLLEDTFGNAFAGKYESVFCANQGTHQQRLDEFIKAVRFVYASTMSEKALTYRAQRNVLDRDEQMALLVQRVSGAPYGGRFFPQLAGVGFSYNPYVWNKSIDPEAGMLRLVFGLGTRAVERHDDDYTRLVALNAPGKRPEGKTDELRRYAQRLVDLLDLNENRFSSCRFEDLLDQSPNLPVEMFASRDRGPQISARDAAAGGACPWMLTFDHLLSKTAFAEDMREMLQVLREAYGAHVDIEFTANFLDDGSYKINIVQCRPFQVMVTESSATAPRLEKRDVILKAHGPVIGPSRTLRIDRLIYVVPSVYGHLPMSDRHAIARLIGKLTHLEKKGQGGGIMLVGPGRWGASMPSLGVPVSFSEINTVSVLCEIDAMHEHVTPDLSLGTHFFNDLVEMDMLYVGFLRSSKNNVLNEEFLNQSPNCLQDLVPEASAWSRAVRVIAPIGERGMVLNADLMKQKAVLYLASAKQ